MMAEIDPLTLCLLAAALGQSLMVLVLTGVTLVGRRTAGGGRGPLHLWSLAGFFLLEAVDIALEIREQIWEIPSVTAGDAVTVLSPLFVILVWTYVRGLTEPDARPAPRDARHLGWVALALVLLLPLLTLSDEAIRIAEMEDGEDHMTPELALHVLPAIVGILGFLVLWIGLMAGYGFVSVRRLVRVRRRMRQVYSRIDEDRLRGLGLLIVLIFGFVAVSIVDHVSMLTLEDNLLDDRADAVYELALVTVFGLFGLLQKPLLEPWTAEVPTDPAGVPLQTETAAAAEPDPPTRYARAALSAEDGTRILAKLDRAMAVDQLWRDPFVSLRDLADRIGVSTNNLSQALNAHLGVSFYDYVNRWRIEEACRLLRDSDHTVLAIAEASGFNSKSTFNAAFRKALDTTPSAYRKSAPDTAAA